MALPLERLTAPDLDAFADMGRAALAQIPPPFDAAAREIGLQVADFADDDTLASLGISDPFELTGLYDGVPLTGKSVMDQPEGPDVIWLYRRPLLDEWAARGTVPLGALVAHVVVHELAHHFGWSDDDIARIDRWWD